MKKQIVFSIVLLVCQGVVFSATQKHTSLDNYFKELKNLEFNKAINSLNVLSSIYDKQLIVLAQLLSHNGQLNDPLIYSKIKTFNSISTDDEFGKSLTYLINGYYKLIESSTRPEAYSDFDMAYQKAKFTAYGPLIKQCLLAILKLYRSGVLHNDDSFNIYLSEYLKLCVDASDYLYFYSFQFNLYSQTQLYEETNSFNDSLFKITFKKLDSLKGLIKPNNKLLVYYYYDKGNYTIRTDPGKARSFYKRSLKYCDTTLFYKPLKFDLLLQLSRVEDQNKNYANALNYVYEAKKYKNENDTVKAEFALKWYKAEYHAKLRNYDSAYQFMRESRYLGFQLNFQSQNSQIAKLEIENGVKQKELENLQLKTDVEKQQRQQRNLWIGGIAILLIGSIFGFLIYKNTKRKQKLAEQEKALETHKLATVLKEQELTAIDAMIEGQEKERQRIANDLHDDLGGLMATVKLHFNALKDKQSPELFDKTNKLLDEAYNKIRTIAHAKNSGVMAKQGLLKAVKEIAHTVSVSNKISIDIIDHGLEERLENSLELTIFRIIQELITNVIKHAEATEVSIHITNHEDSLNIMVEDNGKGFDTKKILKTSGMGIHSIDKRIENLGGTVTIESELNKGTTVIIDIPS